VTAALELAKQRAHLAHEQILKVVDGLTDEQLAWQPSRRAHSLAWTLWHIARCADKFASEAAPNGRRAEIWETEGLARRWGLEAALHGANGVGTGIDDALVASLRPPDRESLFSYARRAFAAVDDLVDRLDDAALAREHVSFFTEGTATVGRALFTSITHDNRHLGELEYIKGLLGLRGSATR
jgi:uncharacterized damage-inducible protein DinB